MMMIALIVLLVAAALAIAGTVCWFYWLAASWLVDGFLHVDGPTSFALKFILTLLIIALLGAIQRIGTSDKKA